MTVSGGIKRGKSLPDKRSNGEVEGHCFCEKGCGWRLEEGIAESTEYH